ncbi:MAG: cupin [Brachybacterium sp.]|nr:cupin [Brachybacterium sp.]
MDTLDEIAERALTAAREAENGRHAEIVVHDGPLRQTVFGLRAATQLGEHNSPPAASMQVLTGRVRITGEDPVELSAGQLAALTHQRHGVTALEDTVFLLTTVTGVPGEESRV